MAAYLNNQQQMQRPMDSPHEIIPLQRMTTREEATERQRIRDIFDKVSFEMMNVAGIFIKGEKGSEWPQDCFHDFHV